MSSAAAAAFASDKSSPGAWRHDALQQSRAKRPAPEAADADSAAAKGEVVDPRHSGVAQARACSVHFEGGSEIALLF